MTTPYKQIKARIYNHQHWVVDTEPEKLKEKYTSLLQKSGFTILKFDEHYFEEQGYTCFWLLAESHLAIHTFPENNTTYVELSSCNEEKMEVFKRLTSV
jgi:S-adenosylmethionine decarboxylase